MCSSPSGTVEPYSELDCEVVWHASFSSPQEGDFDLYCFDGNIQRLHCIAKVSHDYNLWCLHDPA